MLIWKHMKNLALLMAILFWGAFLYTVYSGKALNILSQFTIPRRTAIVSFAEHPILFLIGSIANLGPALVFTYIFLCVY